MQRFPRQMDMFASADALQSPRVYASCDKGGAGGKKWFAHFASHAAFASAVAATPEHERCFYEMVREGHECNLYLDIEYCGAPEADHASIRALLLVLERRLRATLCVPEVEDLGTVWDEVAQDDHEHAYEVLQHNALEELLSHERSPSVQQISALPGLTLAPGHAVHVQGRLLAVRDTRPALRRHVMCSTREVGSGGDVKHSYHVVYPGVVFGCNHDGAMQQLVAQLCREFVVPDGRGRCWKRVPAPPDGGVSCAESARLAPILAQRVVLTEAEAAGLHVTPSIYVPLGDGSCMLPRKGKTEGLVDILVYTKNRGMRTALSHKHGVAVSFRRVRELCSPDIAACEDEAAGSFITQIPAEVLWRPTPSALHTVPLRKQVAGAKRRREVPRPMASPARTPELAPGSPFARVFLGEDSRLTMDRVEKLPEAVGAMQRHGMVSDDDICTFYLERPRRCPWHFLLDRDHRHRSNNAHGVHVRTKAGHSHIFLKCLDEDCQQERRKLTCKDARTGELCKWDTPHDLVLKRYTADPRFRQEDLANIRRIFSLPACQREQVLMRDPHTQLAWLRVLGGSWVALPTLGIALGA